MGTVILIRHARSLANAENILAGQTPGVRLDAQGIEQSKRLADVLGAVAVTRVFVSPLERCLATITPWIARHGAGIAIQSEPRIIEPNYGAWSGRKLDELALEPLWQVVQNDPERMHFPDGERFLDVWLRVQEFYHALSECVIAGENAIVVSHGDIIKFLLANVLNMEFKNFQSLVVEPASISVATITKEGARLLHSNRSLEPLENLFSNISAPTLGGEVRHETHSERTM